MEGFGVKNLLDISMLDSKDEMKIMLVVQRKVGLCSFAKVSLCDEVGVE